MARVLARLFCILALQIHVGIDSTAGSLVPKRCDSHVSSENSDSDRFGNDLSAYVFLPGKVIVRCLLTKSPYR